MASRFELITELYRKTLKSVTAPERWQRFLTAASHNYKLSFDEQLLVYAQRPDATAVLEIERWNRQFGRWVNRGATGIAVFDGEYNGRVRLKHYFDISDTHETPHSRPVPIWAVREEFAPDIIETLENSFGTLEDKSDLPTALLSAVKNAVQDNIADYLDELRGFTEGSFLEELDDLNVEVQFSTALQNSIGYMLLSRCGCNVSEYFTSEDFRCVQDFKTPETLNALGTATGDIAKMCLSEIARTVLALQKQNRTFDKSDENLYSIEKETHAERSFDHDQNHIPDGERLPPAEPAAATGAGNSPWEIRVAAPEVSETAPPRDLHQPADVGPSEPAPDGSGTDSPLPDGADNIGYGEVPGGDGGAESLRPDEVGGADEQHPAIGGGSGAERADIQLAKDSGLPPLLDENFIMALVSNKYDDLRYKKRQIKLFFSVHPDMTERAEYLKSAYQERYTEILVDGIRLGHKPQENGLLMWEGAYLTRTRESVFSWELVAGWVSTLVDKKEYYINTDIKALKSQESQQLSLFDTDIPRPEESTVSEPALPRLKYSQQVLDTALCLGGNEPDCLERICAYFSKDYPLEQNAAFLQKEYGRYGKGFFLGERPYSIWFDEKGLRLSSGKSANGSAAMILTWEDVAKRVRELLDLGRYVPQSVIDRAGEVEKNVLAEKLLYLVQDFTDDAREGGYLPTVQAVYNTRASYPDMTVQLAGELDKSEVVESLIAELFGFLAAHDGRELLRSHHHKQTQLLGQLDGLLREPVAFPAPEVPDEPLRQFITEDEIDKLLIGGAHIEHSKFRIYCYFLGEHTPKEKADFLKREYGDGGFGRLGFDESHDSKGITYAREDRLFTPYDKVVLSWSKVEKRISTLIRQGRYMTEEELAYIPTYEKHELARDICTFFDNVPKEQPHPFPVGFDFYDKVKVVQPQLDDPAKVEEIYQMMVPVWESTAQDDREYTWRKTAFENLCAFRDGTFSLFGEKKTPIKISAPLPEEPPSEEEPTAILTPPKPRHERITFSTLHPEIPAEQRHNFHITDMALGDGTRSEKYAANVAAIRLLKQIEREERLASPEEQEVLSRYVGWCGLADCFDERHGKYLELKSLLDKDEYTAARASSLTAFYTSPIIINAMYKVLGQMGFQSGNILEPSCGIGNFIGMLPESMADAKAYGVEIDSISGRIAQQLYQNSSIVVNGFEKVQMPDSFFDVAIGNVPFGDFKVLDKRYDKNHWLIHDYFFGKALDKVRPGGIVAFVTSKGTMDKENSAVRKYLAQRADLIGAIRLPDNAFKRNAGTEVTSDILFLQKRDRMVDMEPDWVHLDTDKNGIRMNSYFVQNPDMVLGSMVIESTRYGMDSACKAIEDADLSQQLADAIQNLHAEITAYEVGDLDEEDRSIPADPNVRNFSYTIVDGSIYFRENSRMHPVDASVTAENRIRGMIALRDCTRRLIELQTEGYPDEDIQQEQEKLNVLYDDFTKKYGLINSRGNSLAFSEDSSYCLLCSLEVLDEEGSFKRKADMFTKRTIRPHEAVTHVDTASEALAVSIAEKACVDLGFMASLMGGSEYIPQIVDALKGVIFKSPRSGPFDLESSGESWAQGWQTADEYLSGNVRVKLREARQAAEDDPFFSGNVTALEAVQPEDLTPGEIGVRISANWIPIEIYEQFMFELFGTSGYARERMKILHSKATNEWNITNKNSDSSNIRARTTYGTSRINAYHILEQTLNQKDVRIFDKMVDENGDERRVLNKKETAIAQDRQELIKSKFAEWIWKDIDRRERLCKIYNETFNSIRPREYDGQHIRFSGMNPEISLRPHQINAIAHVMYGGNTLLAHEVGAGKTFEMVAAAMESKRLGLCTKSLVVVPNHITEQWAAEWLQLYPSANILVATKKDFERQNRRKFCGRIATGDYDAIIIGHSQFEKIPMSRERQQAMLQKQIHEILAAIREAKEAKAERYTVKQMEKTRKSLETRLEKLNDQSRKDDVVAFEELGIDRLFIDESHYFKNLFLLTKMRNVGGIAQTEAQKSSDLFMKCQYLDEITGGHGVIFATGTPISNSMVELYTIQRYLQYNLLQEMGMDFFDDWAANFGETITSIELSPEGTGYRAKTRFARFFNLPELMSAFKLVADIQAADMLQLPVPKANFHTEVIKPSPLQQEMIKGLAERAEAIRDGGVDPRIDNMLRITNDGRKLALDMRLIQPMAPDDENGKIAVCARNVHRIWEQTREQRSAQLVFCDLSTPKNDGSFNVYDDLKKKLMDSGIPEDEIAYIHNANTEAKKKELFARVRSGQVRILMGSTQKMGAGTNVQDRLIALHDVDCPWRPSDLSQRLGRIVRQGNQNPEVEIYRYVTENTFDAYLYQLVENKQKFIAQIMTSKAPVRAAEDVDETALSYSEIKALATGNPLIIEKCNLDMEVSKLNMLKASYLSQKYAMEDMVLRKYPESITRLKERIAGYEEDIRLVDAHPKPQEGFVGIVIDGKTITDKETAGKAILDVCTKMTGSDAVAMGEYRGFSLAVTYNGTSNEYRMSMRGTLTHTITLGADVFGNITRMDNMLDSLATKQTVAREELADTEKQLASAREEMDSPFANEDELAQKSARLKELNILLNMDQKDRSIMDDGPEEEVSEKVRVREYAR